MLVGIVLTVVVGQLLTGGPFHNSKNQTDWEDMYPGCADAIDKTLDPRRAVLSQGCSVQFDACIHAAEETGDKKQLNLCECLFSLRLCVINVVNTQFAGTAVNGCPDIVYSRMCKGNEANIQERYLTFEERNEWSCTSCSDKNTVSQDCVDGLDSEDCLCNFSCDQESCPDGFKCHSFTCVLMQLRCWVFEKKCSRNDAWNLCIHDTPSLVPTTTSSGGVTFNLTSRDLRCRLATCQEAISRIDHDDMPAYRWLFAFSAILVLGLCILSACHYVGRRNYEQNMLRYKLR
eukprot:TRINITY_DN9450_c0_g1_i1.p1 TRINITY_DN9450_c0_g1~~TRINITY_DN9450_c0_g1_i1.p1  ORF type:complete len:311 (+),score=33.56 TRINITY_DN9450_c0_g1_i1:68-934(+)